MPSPESEVRPQMSILRQQVEAEADAIRREIETMPVVAVVAETSATWRPEVMAVEARLPFGRAFEEAAGVKASGPESEERLLLGTVEDTPVAWLPARLLHHGFSAHAAALPVRVLAALGIESFVLLGRAASLSQRLRGASLMLVTDHLNLQGTSPLTGANEDAWGLRFPDMSTPYDPSWRTDVLETSPALQQGVVGAVSGPATPAERRMLQRMGADAVGAGLVPEVLSARHMDRRVLAAVAIEEGREDESHEAPAEEGAALVRAAVRKVEGGQTT